MKLPHSCLQPSCGCIIQQLVPACQQGPDMAVQQRVAHVQAYQGQLQLLRQASLRHAIATPRVQHNVRSHMAKHAAQYT